MPRPVGRLGARTPIPSCVACAPADASSMIAVNRRPSQSLFVSRLRAAVRAVLLVTLSSAFLPAVRAAEPAWQVIDVWREPQGIRLNAVIRCLLQTSDGYLWVGTKAGVARFDGVQFTMFDTSKREQLLDDEVWALAEDARQGLWIGTYGGGVSVLRDGRFTLYTKAHGLINDFVNALATGRDGTMWIGTDEGLSHFRERRFTNYSEVEGNAPLKSVRALDVAPDGALWIGTVTGEVYRFADGRFEQIEVKGLHAGDAVLALKHDRSGTLWIGTVRGLFRWKDGKSTHFGLADGGNPLIVRTLHEDNSGTLWIATSEGLRRFQHGRFYRHDVDTPQSAGNQTYALYQDREGSLWVGAHGLLRMRPALFTSYGIEQGLSYNFISTILPTGDSGLWIGTPRGLNLLHDGNFSTAPATNGLPEIAITALALDRQDRLWVGTEIGLFRSRGAVDPAAGLATVTFDALPERIFPRTYVRNLLEDRGGAIWVNSNNEGLVRIDPHDRAVTFTTADGLPHNALRGLCEDREGNLWIGTRGGLARYRDGAFQTLTAADGLIDTVIENLYLDRHDVLWIGTRRGVSRLENGKIANLSVNEGLFTNFTMGFVEDDEGNLWMSGSKGVFRVAWRDLADVAAGRRAKVEFTSYGSEHGLTSPVVTAAGRRSAVCTPDGRVWFGMSGGLYSVDPRHFPLNRQPPPVHLESVEIDGETQDARRAAVAPPGRGDLAFRFTALSFLAPEKVSFKYRLDGYDSNWVDAGPRRAAYYSNIPPGNYTFRVIAANNDGVWNQTGASFAFRLRPFFYQTGWFYGLCALGVALSGWGLHYGRTRRLRHRERQLVQMVDARTKDLVSEIDRHARTGEELRHYKTHLEEQVVVRTQALQESRAMLQSVIDSVPALIFMKNLEGRFLFVNQAYAELCGTTKEAMIGRTAFDFFNEKEAHTFLAHDLTALSTENAIQSEDKIVRADGERTFLTIKCLLRNKTGEPYAMCGVSTDVTHVKQIEEQFRQSQKMEAIGRLAGGIAHDFNNLLTGINGYCALARDQLDPTDSLYEPLSEILKAGNRAASLTDQLLAYSRKQILLPKRWNVNLIAADMEALLRRIVGEDIEFATVLRPDVGYALVDRGQVEQIILNLAVNARDAMPKGGKLVLQTANVMVDESYLSSHPGAALGPHVMLAVSDTGHGMSEAVKARLFEPFFTTKEQGKGTGLGLSVVYGIVKQSGGSIAVESEVGRGTTFRIYFPLVEKPADEAEPPPSLPPASGRGNETILLVEDEELVRNFTRRALEAYGYTVVTALHGREALQKLEEQGARIQFVITDAVMPEMGGRELGEHLQRLRPDLPVLYISGYTDSIVAQGGLSRDIFLSKPFSVSDLTAKIRYLLAKQANANGQDVRSS